MTSFETNPGNGMLPKAFELTDGQISEITTVAPTESIALTPTGQEAKQPQKGYTQQDVLIGSSVILASVAIGSVWLRRHLSHHDHNHIH